MSLALPSTRPVETVVGNRSTLMSGPSTSPQDLETVCAQALALESMDVDLSIRWLFSKCCCYYIVVVTRLVLGEVLLLWLTRLGLRTMLVGR